MTKTAKRTKATHLTCEILYHKVWETPVSRLAAQYGITGSALAGICKQLQIPTPSSGYWQKKAAGKKVVPHQLLEPTDILPQQITITPTPPGPPGIAPEVRAQIDVALAKVISVTIPEQLTEPHAIIAHWLANHDRRAREAEKIQDPWSRKINTPKPFSAFDQREHRILDTLFKALEQHGVHVKEGVNRSFIAQLQGERIEFRSHEKSNRIRRAVTKSEKRWYSDDWRYELQPTGKIFFTTNIPTGAGLQREWLETGNTPMEDLLPTIVATFIAAVPLLVDERRQRNEEEHKEMVAERRRYKAEERRERERNQRSRFTELANAWRKATVAREFLNALQNTDIDQNLRVGGRSLRDWVGWADTYIKDADPLNRGVKYVFKEIAKVTGETYRD